MLQQKALENRELDLQKIEKLKEAEVQNERKSAEYWKERVRRIPKQLDIENFRLIVFTIFISVLRIRKGAQENLRSVSRNRSAIKRRDEDNR